MLPEVVEIVPEDEIPLVDNEPPIVVVFPDTPILMPPVDPTPFPMLIAPVRVVLAPRDKIPLVRTAPINTLPIVLVFAKSISVDGVVALIAEVVIVDGNANVPIKFVVPFKFVTDVEDPILTVPVEPVPVLILIVPVELFPVPIFIGPERATWFPKFSVPVVKLLPRLRVPAVALFALLMALP